MNTIVEFGIGILGVLYILMVAVYTWLGISKIEEEIGVGYMKKHAKLWFSVSVVQFILLLWMYSEL